MKSFRVIMCILLICLTLSGCINNRHLKDLMVVEGMGIDGTSDQVTLCVQSLRAEAATGGEAPNGNMTIITKEKGDSIFDASANLAKSLSKKVFYGHNKLIVFGNEVCKNDLNKKIDYFLRSSDSRVDVPVCISKTTAQEVIESKENGGEVPVENITSLLKNGEQSGLSAYVTINDLLNMYSDKTTDFYLPVLEKEKKADNVKLAGIGIFNGGKLVYTMNDDETMGLMLIRNKVENCSLEFKDKEFGSVGIDLYEPKITNEAYIKDGKVLFRTEIKVQLIVSELEKGIVTALTKDKLERISNETESKINSLCHKAFNACQKHNSDCVRVGEYLAKADPTAYKSVCNDWDVYFKDVEYNVIVDAQLKKLGDNTQLD